MGYSGFKELGTWKHFHFLSKFSSVQSLSCVQLFVTPSTAARQASLSITISWSSFLARGSVNLELYFHWLSFNFYFISQYSWFKMLCYFHLYSNVTHIYICDWATERPSTCADEEQNGYPLQHSCPGIPRTEKPGGLQSTELQRVTCDLATKQQQQGTNPFKRMFKRLTVVDVG